MPIKKPYFSILLPSRGRAAQLGDCVKNIVDTVACKDDVEIIIGVDTGDDESIAVVDTLIHNPRPYVTAMIDDWPDLGEKYLKLEGASIGEVLLYWADDYVVKSHGWDVSFANRYNTAQGGICVVTCEDELNHGGLSLNGVPGVFGIPRKWYDVLGYYLPQGFKYYCMDTWVWDIARRIQRQVYLHEITITHNHKRVMDKTYEVAAPHLKAEIQQYVDRTQERERDAEKLMEAIKGGGDD